MRTTFNLILVCLLLTCQQHIAAQNYRLGKQKSSFAYSSLYATPNAIRDTTSTINHSVESTPLSTNFKNDEVIINNSTARRNTPSTTTNHSTEPISLSTNLKNVEEITNGMKGLNWTYSTLYKNYSAVANMLLEENSEYSNKVLDEINTIIKRIFQNKLSKDLVEKEINNANKSGESVIQVFLAYY